MHRHVLAVRGLFDRADLDLVPDAAGTGVQDERADVTADIEHHGTAVRGVPKAQRGRSRMRMRMRVELPRHATASKPPWGVDR